MMDSAKWQEENTRLLTAAIASIRARLAKHMDYMDVGRKGAQETPSPQPAQTPAQGTDSTEGKPETRGIWRRFTRKESLPSMAAPPLALPAAKLEQNPETTFTVHSDQMSPPPALITLARRLRLSRFEQDILLLCVAMELDTGIAKLCDRAQGESGRPFPTFALALTIFDEPSWEALSPERPLRYWRLIEISQPAGQPLTTSYLRADERVVNYLKGLNYLDDRLAPLLTAVDPPPQDGAKPASQREVEDTILGCLKQMQSGPPPVIQLIGRDTPSKELVAGSVCGSLLLRLYRLPANLLSSQAADVESFARLWEREGLLLPAALYLDAQNTEAETPAGQAISLLLGRARGLTFLDTRDSWHTLSSLTVEAGKPTASEQQAIWIAELGEAAGDSPAQLAGQFNLGAKEIRDIARIAIAAGGSEPVADRLWNGALTATRPRLDALAQHIDCKSTWDDIVLPEPGIGLLHQIADQVGKRTTVYHDWGFADKMSRGLGITALFAGDSGTGKTLAAEVLANALRLSLHRVDLSSVVSKYIGETEKNLRRLFDAAEDCGVILFFDEADALFGKRSEVKDSHDRYANIEVNYLLQRMESYRGLAILATNTKSALDQAFVRRLRFIVTFPFPGIAERKAIWQRVFPKQTPTDALDFDRLARLNVTGGHIHNIALNAAFRAAQSGTPVTMPIVFDAARTEFRKLERPVNESDFRWHGAA
jgi:hypothetical protein